MANAIGAAYRVLDGSRIADVTVEKFDGSSSVAQLSGRTPRIVIQHPYVVTLLDQASYQGASDESRPSGHQISLQGHSRFTRQTIDLNYSSVENARHEAAKSLRPDGPAHRHHSF
jgi:hypothetical protein